MTISEANAVNLILEEALGRREPDVSNEQVRAAAVLLADKASKALSAGISGRDIPKRWPKSNRVRPVDMSTCPLNDLTIHH